MIITIKSLRACSRNLSIPRPGPSVRVIVLFCIKNTLDIGVCQTTRIAMDRGLCNLFAEFISREIIIEIWVSAYDF